MNDHGLSTLDDTRVRQTVTAMILAVDLRDFAAAERLFAPRVNVDYTSLWGGSASETARAELIGAWRGLLPGFDATWHELGEIDVRRAGARAHAGCAVAARHWIGGEVWLPRGRYEFELVDEGAWRITAMRLVLTEEIGDRGLVARAQARAAAG